MSVAYTTHGGWINWDDFFNHLDKLGFEVLNDPRSSSNAKLLKHHTNAEVWCYRNEYGNVGSWEELGVSKPSDVLSAVTDHYELKIVNDMDAEFWWG